MKSFIKLWLSGWVGVFVMCLIILLHLATLGLSSAISYKKHPMKYVRDELNEPTGDGQSIRG